MTIGEDDVQFTYSFRTRKRLIVGASRSETIFRKEKLSDNNTESHGDTLTKDRGPG